MGKVRIVTDSTADLSEDIKKRYDITVVQLKVIFGQETLLDGVTIKAPEFFRRQVAGELSSTSQPSPAEFIEYYRPLAEAGDEIISIHISGLLSGTVQSANLAKTMMNYPAIEVVDSRVTSMALGMLVINLAMEAEAGRSKQELLQMITDMQKNMRVYFMVDTLEYLQRGGRIGKAQALLGTLLNIKPILEIKKGQIYPLEKVRGRSRALSRLVSFAEEHYGRGPAAVRGGARRFPGSVEEVRAKTEETFDCPGLYTGHIGPVIGTHTVPGVVGLICLRR
jgi:DegV family protein with EDD domain